MFLITVAKVGLLVLLDGFVCFKIHQFCLKKWLFDKIIGNSTILRSFINRYNKLLYKKERKHRMKVLILRRKI